MNELKVGDTCYVSDFGRKEVEIDCPVCFRTGKVTLIIGNGDHVTMSCEFCQNGLGTPSRGYVKNWRLDAGVKIITIDEVETKSSLNKGMSIEYRADYHTYYPENVFATKEEAIAESDRKAKEYNLEQDTKAELIKGRPNKSYSWNAGYHMRAVKEAQNKINYHSKKARICKSKSKENE
jgi:hypothetical protein